MYIRISVFVLFETIQYSTTIEFFTVCTKLAEMALLYSKESTTAKKKLPPVGLDLMQEIITSLGLVLDSSNDKFQAL